MLQAAMPLPSLTQPCVPQGWGGARARLGYHTPVRLGSGKGARAKQHPQSTRELPGSQRATMGVFYSREDEKRASSNSLGASPSSPQPSAPGPTPTPSLPASQPAGLRGEPCLPGTEPHSAPEPPPREGPQPGQCPRSRRAAAAARSRSPPPFPPLRLRGLKRTKPEGGGAEAGRAARLRDGASGGDGWGLLRGVCRRRSDSAPHTGVCRAVPCGCFCVLPLRLP